MYSQFAMARKGERQECHHSFLTSRPEEREVLPYSNSSLPFPSSILPSSLQLACLIFKTPSLLLANKILEDKNSLLRPRCADLATGNIEYYELLLSLSG